MSTNKKPVYFLNGCFDLLHAGHFNFLSFVAEIAHIENAKMIVAIDSDAKIKKDKGSMRPFFTAEERAETLLSLRFHQGGIDEVLFFDTNEELDNLVKICKPQIMFKGECWRGNIVGEKHAEEICFYPEDEIPISSTKIVDRVIDKWGEQFKNIVDYSHELQFNDDWDD